MPSSNVHDRPIAMIQLWRARTLAFVMLLAVALASSTADVWAHGETTPVIRTVVDGLSTRVPGLTVRILPGLPTNVSLVNASAAEVLVVGDLHEPFLRVGPHGVFANVNSPTWYGSGNPDGIALNLPHSARAGALPHWIRVSARPVWGWFDRRVQPPGPAVPRQALQGRRPVRLVDWSIPLRYRSHPLQIRGHVEYRPPIGAIVATLRSPAAVAPGVSVSLLGGAVPGLFLTNAGSRPVTVYGEDGQPFARIGPAGVSVDVHSTIYLAQQNNGSLPPARPPRPLWRQVTSVPRYDWIDPRLRYGSLDPPSDVSRQTHRVTLRNWSIPVQTAVGRRSLNGSLDWVPSTQPASTVAGHPGANPRLANWLLPSVAFVVIAALGALELRRRQARLTLPRNDPRAG